MREKPIIYHTVKSIFILGFIIFKASTSFRIDCNGISSPLGFHLFKTKQSKKILYQEVIMLLTIFQFLFSINK